MEPAGRTRHHEHHMDPAAPRRPSRALGGALVLIALGATLTYLLLPSDGITLGRVAQVLAAFTAFLSAVRDPIGDPAGRVLGRWRPAGARDVHAGRGRRGLPRDGPGRRPVRAARRRRPSFLVLLVPLIALARNEFRAHFESPDRREIAADVMLVTVAVASILYVLLRPDERDAHHEPVDRGLGGARRDAAHDLLGALPLGAHARARDAVPAVRGARRRHRGVRVAVDARHLRPAPLRGSTCR